MADAKKALAELLCSLGESSKFAASGSLPPVLPGLKVKGVGSIGSPVSAADAKRIIGQAEQAPYGRGEETILDTNVRRVWQLDPAKFTLDNREWQNHVAAIVDAVKQDFGIAQKVKAELYKLLVYEKGSFFAPHRDTEKTARMFGTLVICLPSRHEGGSLIVRHEGQTESFDFSNKESQFKTQYAAFYADCEHEIEPITSGYRVCLVYNLATAGRKQPSPPKNLPAVKESVRLLTEVFAAGAAGPDKIVVPFRHQYTEAGLDPRELKGSDRACADVLLRAAESLGYEIHIALLTHWQSGEPDYETLDYDPYRRGSYRRYRYDDEDSEDDYDSDDGSDAEMGEVYDETMKLDHWLDPQGGERKLGEISLDESEILATSERKDWACRKEINEASGNEGASMERWYRQGVVVIWPSDRKYHILAGEGQQAALPELERMAARARKPDALANCRAFAAGIIACWRHHRRVPTGEAGFSGRMLAVLDRIDEADLALKFVEEVLPKDFDGSEGAVLLQRAAGIGWHRLASALCRLIAQQKPDDYHTKLDRLAAMCRPVCCDPPAVTDERREACADVAAALAEAIERWDAKKAGPYYGERPPRKGVVDDMLRILAAVSDNERSEWLVEHVIADPAQYGVREVLIPEVTAIHDWLPKFPTAAPAAARLLEHCRNELLAATARPIEPPKDWAREADLGCKCADCKELAAFLRDPASRVGRFPLRKERRQHLHGIIDSRQCDCTHVTDRRGSPQTLVCTKTQASYERKLKQYESDLATLKKLETIAKGKKLKQTSRGRTSARAAAKKRTSKTR
jgi:predicted 2-oxoglutarate/Fe(II)-dependent dioxygenase YbiX